MALTDPSIPALLRRRAREAPDAIILRKKDRGIWKATNWADLSRQAHAFSAALNAASLPRGAVVGVLSEISMYTVTADLGTLAAGMVALAVYPSDPADAVAHVLRDAGCALVFVEGEEQLDKILHIRDRCPALQRVVIFDMKGLHDFIDPMCEGLTEFLGRGNGSDSADFAAEETAVLAYTTGSTGAPRGVRLSHRNIMAQINGALTLTGLGAGDERLAFLPLALLNERVLGLYLALAADCISNIVESVETVPENLAEVRPTVLIAPPRVWQRLATGLAGAAAGATRVQRSLFNWALGSGNALARRLVIRPALATIGLDRLRCGWVGGAPVAPALVAQFAAIGVHLTEFYGLTEAGGLAQVNGTIAAASLRISADGEIQICGDHVALRYQDGGRLTDSEGWLSTGDIGRIEGGRVRIEGRASERIARHDGAVVMPSGLETALRTSRFIADALVVDGGPMGLACLVMVDQDVLDDWAQSQDLPPGNFAALVHCDAVRNLLQTEIDRVNATALVKLVSFNVIDRRLEPGDPELTPMMLLRRGYVTEKYRDMTNSMP